MKKFLLCLLLVVLFSGTTLADTFRSEYAEGEVLVLIKAPTSLNYYSVMGIFSTDVYSRSVSDQAERFARSRELEALSTYPALARNSGESIILLRSRHKSTEELVRELSSAPDVISVQRNHRTTTSSGGMRMAPIRG